MTDGLKLKYFVLNPGSGDDDYAQASRCALIEFSDVIEDSNPVLAVDLRNWVHEFDMADKTQ
jgi:hypothetical protein